MPTSWKLSSDDDAQSCVVVSGPVRLMASPRRLAAGAASARTPLASHSARPSTAGDDRARVPRRSSPAARRHAAHTSRVVAHGQSGGEQGRVASAGPRWVSFHMTYHSISYATRSATGATARGVRGSISLAERRMPSTSADLLPGQRRYATRGRSTEASGPALRAGSTSPSPPCWTGTRRTHPDLA